MKIRNAMPPVVLVSLLSVPGCGAGKKLPPCPSTDIRVWCRCEVAQTTEERAAAGLPVACTIPFVATTCAEKSEFGGMSPGGSTELIAAIHKFESNYADPSGWPPYLVVDGKAYWLRCPAQTDKGYADCITNNQPTNPWPSYPVADLDSANPIKPGLKPQGFGGSGTGGGATEGGDCAICLANAQCDGLTQDQCVTMHCAAVCPWDNMPAATCQDTGGAGGSPIGSGPSCAASGEACGIGASCCDGLYCFASDVGSVCM